jgi:hypothetical protein
MIALSAACGGGANDSNGAQWIGQTYQLTIHNGLYGDENDWRLPTPDLGAKISGPVIPQFLLAIGAASAGQLTVTLATAQANLQDPCTGTVQTAFAGDRYPDATIGPVDFPMRLEDPRSGRWVHTTIHDVTFGSVLPGPVASARGTFDATIDIGEIYPLVTVIPDPSKESVCATLADFMVPCQTCSFNGQPYCLPMEAVGLEATPFASDVTSIEQSALPASCDN